MTLEYEVKQPAHIIFEYLSNMQKFVSVHPVINKIDLIAGNRYLVYETLKLGFVPFSFTYPVIINSDEKNKTVNMQATVMKITHINMNFVIDDQNNSCLIKEDIEFKSLLPVKLFMQNIFKIQHQQLFKNIENLELVKTKLP